MAETSPSNPSWIQLLKLIDDVDAEKLSNKNLDIGSSDPAVAPTEVVPYDAGFPDFAKSRLARLKVSSLDFLFPWLAHKVCFSLFFFFRGTKMSRPLPRYGFVEYWDFLTSHISFLSRPAKVPVLPWLSRNRRLPLQRLLLRLRRPLRLQLMKCSLRALLHSIQPILRKVNQSTWAERLSHTKPTF